MGSNRLLTPGFINKLDRQLLKTNPVTWSTRIHLAMYYGLTFSVLLILICFIVPDDPRNDPAIYNWVILLSIVSLLAFVFWMIYLLRFNVFKRYGKWRSIDSGKTFFLYFLIVLLVVSWPFIPPLVQSARANNAFSGDELVKDINNMNIKLCQLERDSINTRFSKDTFLVKHSINEVTIYDVNGDERNYYTIDTASLHEKLAKADSARQINDSVHVIYSCPDYQFIHHYAIANYTAGKVLSSMDIFRQVLQDQQTPDTGKTKAELAALFSKYSPRYDRNALIPTYEDYSVTNDPTYFDRVRDKYDLYFINNSIGNITEKKYRWDSNTIEVSLRVLYYITLILVLLVTIYRHTTRRTFFLALLTALVLTILTGLFLVMPGSGEGAVFTWIIIYFIIFAIFTIAIARSKHRNVVSGIALNLLVFITPFIPLVVTASYYSALRAKYYSQWQEYEHLFRNIELHYFIAEVCGFVLLLLLLATLYQRAFRKWYALPEQ